MSPINKTFLKQDLEFRLLKDIMAASIELGFALKLSLIIDNDLPRKFKLNVFPLPSIFLKFYNFFINFSVGLFVILQVISAGKVFKAICSPDIANV